MKNLAVILVVFLSIQIGFAQKYKNTETATVTTHYKGTSFTSKKSLAENLENAEAFTFFSQILTQPSVADVLFGEEMVTVFVPTNAAFASFSDKDKEALLKDTTTLQELVKQHTVPGRVDAHSITYQMEKTGGAVELKTLAGQTLRIRKKGETLILSSADKSSAMVLDSDFYHKNGFFHVVDGAILPVKKDK